MLAEAGFYNGLAFHRVIPNFVIRWMSLFKGYDRQARRNRRARYSIDCELDGNRQYHDRGVLPCHAGRNTGGSQFLYATAATTPAISIAIIPVLVKCTRGSK